MKYTSRENTPLKFHKFIFYVLLPFRFLTGLYNMLQSDNALKTGLYIIALGLILASFIGFFKFKKYSWYTIMIYAGYELAMVLMTSGWQLAMGSDSAAFVLGELVAGLALYIAMFIYYAHRKALFMPELIQQPIITPVTPSPTSQPQDSDFRFCPQCGTELEANSTFCHKCGARLR